MNRSLHLSSTAAEPGARSAWGKTRAFRLAALLSCCVILWFYGLRWAGLASSSPGVGLDHILGDALLTFSLAFVVVKVWLSSAPLRGPARQYTPQLFARAALIAGVFALLLVLVSSADQILDRAFGVAPTHLFHGQSRGSQHGRVGDIISAGLADAFLGYLLALPLVLLGLSLLHGGRRDGRPPPSAVRDAASLVTARSLVSIAVAFVMVGAGVAASAFTLSKRFHRDPQAAHGHAQVVTRVLVEMGFAINDLRVTVQAAEWVRQPHTVETVGPMPAKTASNPDRVYLEVTFENTGALLRSVGRGEFRLRASEGATWPPLADDFPDIVLGPTETLTTRLVFEVPPQAERLALVSTTGAAEARIPIDDDVVGGIFGALCRALSKPRES